MELCPAFGSDGPRDYCSGLSNLRFEALVREVRPPNHAITEDKSLSEGFYIRHSYFCNMKPETCAGVTLASIVDYEPIPVFKEHQFDEPSKAHEWINRLRRSLR